MTNIWLILVLIVSHVIQGITGFAGTLLAMPMSSNLIGFETARGMMNFLTIMSAVVIVAGSYKAIHWKELGEMVSVMLIGLIIGIGLIRIVEIPILLKIYGVMILIIALRGILQISGVRLGREDFLPKKIRDFLMLLVLFGAGIFHGMYVSGGALVVIYAAQKFQDKTTFRVTVAMIWILLNTFIGVSDAVSGRLTGEMFRYFLIGILPCLGATFIGVRLQKYLSVRMFMGISYGLLIISAITLL